MPRRRRPNAAAEDLSPRNPQYLSELAQLLARTGGAEQALALFRTAQESTEFLGPVDAPAALARALRGQGYALIELGRYDEAEAIYHQVLEKTPDDRIARGQLQYVAQQRAAGAQRRAPPP